MKPCLYGIGLALGITVASTPGWAAVCGDTTGPGGTRVPCACGDAVTTDTKLKDTDPVVSTGPADVCGGYGLLVGPSGVTLNCNRLTLRGSGSGAGVILPGETSDEITVKNCTVTGFSVGIVVNESDDFRLQDNTVVDNSFDGITIEESFGGTVWGNKVGNNGGGGISCSDSTGSVFAKNHVFGNSGGGIAFPVDGSHNSITDNTVENNSGIGIFFGDSSGVNEVVNNHIHKNGGDGIVVSDSISSLFAHNVVSDNDGAGINIEFEGAGNTIVANFGKRNAGNGLEIDGEFATGNVVANNEFNKNGGHGICVIPGNTDGGGNIGKLNALPPDVTFSGGC